MADFTIDASELKRLRKNLAKAGVDYQRGAKRLLKEIGKEVKDLAFKYAPRSPTKDQYRSTLKGKKSRAKGSNFHPGQLEKSITAEAGKNYVSIGVPINSPAGKYAEKIHEEKGDSWHKLGVGSKAKGSKVDDKYIFRAYDDTPVDELVDKVIDDLTRGIGV